MLRTIGGLDKIGASQSHLAQALQATSFPGLDTPYTPPTHFFYGLVKTWVDNVNSYPPIYVWNIWRPGAFDGGWLLRRPPAYWLRLQASGVRGRNGGGPLVLEEPDQGTVGPLGTADQANQWLLQGSGHTALQTRASTMEPTADHPPRSSDQQIFCWTKKHNWGHPTRDVISDGFGNE